jgi:hypothetical protein
MNLVKLQEKLIRAARGNPPSDRVPYAFEQRILARLRAQPLPDRWALWAGALWRAAAPCVAIMLLLGAWTLVAPAHNPASTPNNDLSQAFENTLLAASDQEPTTDTTW